MPEKILKNLCVKDISSLVVRDPTTVDAECSLDDLLVKIVEDKRTRHAYVVDKNGHLVGSVRMSNLIARLFPYGPLADDGDSVALTFPPIFNADSVEEFMNPDPCCVKEKTPLKEVAEVMEQESVSELPIVDDEKHVIGEVNILEIIVGYLKAKGVKSS